MTEENVYAALTPIFQEIFDDPDLVAAPEMAAEDVPEWNSLNNIKMVVAVEEHFNIRFTTQELSANRNVGEFVAMILEKTGG